MVLAGVASKKFVSGQGTVDANGNCQIEFPQPPSGSFWTGSIIVFDSPQGIFWSVNISGQITDETYANQTVQGVQISSSDVLTLVAIAPTDTITSIPTFESSQGAMGAYIGQTFHATFIAIESPEASTELITPGHDAFNQVSGYTRIIFNGTATTGTVFFQVEPTDRALIIFTSSNTQGVDQVESGLGFDYLPMTVVQRPLGGASGIGNVLNGPLIVPIFGQLEQLSAPTPMRVVMSAAVPVIIAATPDPYFHQPIQEPDGVAIMNGLGVLGANISDYIGAVQDKNHATAFTPNKVNVASGGTTTLLAAPSVGNYWEITTMGIFTPGPFTAAGFIQIEGLSTALTYYAVTGPTGATPFGSTDPGMGMVINEGLQGNSSGIGVNSSVYCIARQVPK